MTYFKASLLWLVGLLVGSTSLAAQPDPHYSEAGFFDIHLCHWPEEGRFVMALFSSARFAEIDRVIIQSPEGNVLGELDLTKFRAFKGPTGQDKRAYITHFPPPAKPVDGWYKSIVQFKDGRRYEASDYVIHTYMNLASGMTPAPGSEGVEMPKELRWEPLPGARHYQVFIRDKWNDTLLFQSKLFGEPFFPLPEGLLKRGGYYGWSIHARDVDEHVLLGDFNHGTTSGEYTFTVR